MTGSAVSRRTSRKSSCCSTGRGTGRAPHLTQLTSGGLQRGQFGVKDQACGKLVRCCRLIASLLVQPARVRSRGPQQQQGESARWVVGQSANCLRQHGQESLTPQRSQKPPAVGESPLQHGEDRLGHQEKRSGAHCRAVHVGVVDLIQKKLSASSVEPCKSSGLRIGEEPAAQVCGERGHDRHAVVAAQRGGAGSWTAKARTHAQRHREQFRQLPQRRRARRKKGIWHQRISCRGFLMKELITCGAVAGWLEMISC